MMKILLLLSFFFTLLPLAHADETNQNWYDRWLERVSKTQAEQPHWVTPLVTVTPRLEQEFRSDYVAQYSPKGHALSNLGNGKGLELIPIDPIEVIFKVPPYLIHNNPKIQDGFGDFSMLLKYRILSANEKEGNYIVSVFLDASFPTGTADNGSTTTILTPSLSVGKGYGDADIQSTLGLSIPMASIGNTLSWNTALQYHFLPYFWPEIEDNFSHFLGGTNGGSTQNYLTPGLVVGRFILHERTAFTVGAGYQVATSDYRPYQHAWILSARLPF